MSDRGEKNADVPFDLPEEDDGSESVFSSVDGDGDDVLSSTGSFPETGSSGPGKVSIGSTGPHPAVGNGGSPNQSSPAAGQPPSTGPQPAVTGKAALVVEPASGGPSRTITIDQARFQIGRGRGDLDLRDEFVSPWHAQLRQDNGKLLLEDMGSRNGVYLRIADDLLLEDLDEILVGRQRLAFRTTWDDSLSDASSAGEATPELGAPLSRPRGARVIRYAAGGAIAGVQPVGSQLTIGQQGADIVCPDDNLLASPHATIVNRGGDYYIKDAQSQFGTFIRIHDPVELIDGDCFIVGRTRIQLAYP